jgi:prophage tail gpP-like protein
MSEASLTVNGTDHLGWQEVTITRSMEQLAHTFELGFTEVWAEKKKPVPIREGDVCTLKLDGKVVTTGHVDDASIDYDANDHTMRVAGRSLTGDLVDCSAIYKTGHWSNQPLLNIAKNLCDPFNILVSNKTDLGDKFKWFAIQDGDSVYETLERACRLRGVVMATTANGHLVFDKIGAVSTQTVIERGVNVLKGGRAASWQDRFSQYTLKAQASGDDNTFGLTVAQPKKTVTDDEVNRHRPIVIMAETQAVGSQLTKRANWERNVRAGRSTRLKYTLDGWTNKEGIWAPNTLVRVVDDWLQVNTVLLVISVRLTKSGQGTFTELELADAKSMTVEPLTKQPKGNDRNLEYLRGSK